MILKVASNMLAAVHMQAGGEVLMLGERVEPDTYFFV